MPGRNRITAESKFLILKFKREDFFEEVKFIKSATIPVLKATCNAQYFYKKIDISVHDNRH